MEKWLIKNLKQIEPGLKFTQSQTKVPGGQRLDVLCQDKLLRPVIIELQQGELDRNHLYKSLEYRDTYQIQTGITPRVILVAESVTTLFRKICNTHQLELKIIKFPFEEAPTQKIINHEALILELTQYLVEI